MPSHEKKQKAPKNKHQKTNKHQIRNPNDRNV
jgi:hypothetical protein